MGGLLCSTELTKPAVQKHGKLHAGSAGIEADLAALQNQQQGRGAAGQNIEWSKFVAQLQEIKEKLSDKAVAMEREENIALKAAQENWTQLVDTCTRPPLQKRYDAFHRLTRQSQPQRYML